MRHGDKSLLDKLSGQRWLVRRAYFAQIEPEKWAHNQRKKPVVRRVGKLPSRGEVVWVRYRRVGEIEKLEARIAR